MRSRTGGALVILGVLLFVWTAGSVLSGVMFFLHWNSRGFPGTSYDAGRLFGAILGPFFWFFIARAVFKAGLARSAHPADPGVANQEAKGEVAKVHLPIDILIKNLNGEIPQYVVREY